METRRAAEDGEEIKRIRRGWCFGDETFRRELLEQAEHKADENHHAATLRETTEEKARREVTRNSRRRLSVWGQRRYYSLMSITAEKVAEVLALPQQDRAYLAHQLIASLDDTVDADVETQWNEVIDRRSREIEEGKVTCRPVEETVRDIRAKLNARR